MMRAVVLSPGTETRLWLAPKRVKLRQVGVYAKERMALGRYLHESIPGSLTFDGPMTVRGNGLVMSHDRLKALFQVRE
jgi:hypothetical protein